MADNEYEIVDDGEEFEIIEDRGPGGFGGVSKRPGVNPQAAKSVAREMVSGTAGGIAGSLALAPLTGGTTAGLTAARLILPALVQGATYYLANKGMGGDPTAADTFSNMLGQIGGVFRAGGSTPLKSAIAQGATDVAGMTAMEKLGLASETSGLAKLGTGLFSTVMERGAGGEPLRQIPEDPRLQASARRLGLGEVPTRQQSMDLVPYARSWSSPIIESNMESIVSGIQKSLPEAYERGAGADAYKGVLYLLEFNNEKLTQEAKDRITSTLQQMSPMQAGQLEATLRETLGNAPVGVRIGRVQPLLDTIGFDPSMTPKTIGEKVQSEVGERVKKELAEASAAYEPVLKGLQASPDMVDSKMLQEEMMRISDEFRAELPSAKKFYRPASVEAERMAKGAPIPDKQRIVSPEGGFLTGTEELPEATIGQISTAIKETNMLLRTIKPGRDNAPRRKALWEYRNALERLGDKFAKDNPNSPSAKLWEDYGTVREQYRGPAERARAFEDLPDDAINIGLGIARGRTESQPNPVLDILDKFYPQEAFSEPGRKAGMYSVLEKQRALDLDQFTPDNLTALKKVVGMTPEQGRMIDDFAAEIKRDIAPMPVAPKDFLDSALPLGPDDFGRPGRVALAQSNEKTRNLWGVLDKMPFDAPKRVELRGAIHRDAIERSLDSKGMINLEKFSALIEANSSVLPLEELKAFRELETAFSAPHATDLTRIQLEHVTAAMKDAKTLPSFVQKWTQELLVQPEMAKTMMDTVGSQPALKERFQKMLLSSLAESKETDPFSQLLDFSKRLRDTDQKALYYLLGRENYLTAMDIERVTTAISPLLNNLRSQVQGRNTLGEVAQWRQYFSLSSFVKMGAMGGLGFVGAPAAIGPIIGALAMGGISLAPEIMVQSILKPRNRLRKAFNTAAKVIFSGARGGGVAGIREEAEPTQPVAGGTANVR